MAGEVLVGVDIGTQGTKAALYNDRGIRLAEAFIPSQLHRPAPGVVEEDPEHQVRSVCLAVRQTVEKAKIGPASVAGMAIDGQMAGIIGIGADGRHITPYDSWLDTRCSAYIDLMIREAGEQIIKKTGNAPSFNHGPKILWWKHQRGETFAKIRSFVQPGGYAAMRLCGFDANSAFVDRTYLHFSGFAENRESQWDEELCAHFAVDPGKLPRIVESSTIVGGLTAEMAAACGLSKGTRVVAGCGDTVASFIAAGATRAGICVDVAGTASVFAATTSSLSPDVDDKILGCGQSAIPGLWHPYAYINGGGMNLEWFCREIANRGKSAGPDLLSLDDLNRAAESVENPEAAPLFVPHFAGRVTPAMPYLRGAWVGLDWSHSIAHLYLGALEGVALEYGIYLRVLKRLYPNLKLEEIVITGGGERSVLWNQIKADVLGIPVVQLKSSGGAPMGSALIAGFGIGLFSDLNETAHAWIQTGRRFRPEVEKQEKYSLKVHRYEALVDILNAFSLPSSQGTLTTDNAGQSKEE
jgi:xylulokinase